MKCSACQYEYEEEWKRGGDYIVIKGDDRFIVISGTFLVERGGWDAGKKEIYLFACPKCKTVKIED